MWVLPAYLIKTGIRHRFIFPRSFIGVGPPISRIHKALQEWPIYPARVRRGLKLFQLQLAASRPS